MTRTCPECGGRLQRCEGEIREVVAIKNDGTLKRQREVWATRPATFLACSACEHCEEVHP